MSVVTFDYFQDIILIKDEREVTLEMVYDWIRPIFLFLTLDDWTFSQFFHIS